MSIKQVFLWAFIIRLLIIPFFFHPDIKDIHIRVSYLSAEVFNIYDFLKQNDLTRINAPDFVYPPLTYFSLGSYQMLIHPLLGEGFNNWLFDFSGKSANNPHIFRYLFLLKLPYILFDFIIGIILYQIFKQNEQRKKALFFWFFNPLNLYGIYALGQFDIIPTFLTFYSWYLWTKQKFSYSGMMIGLGIAFKSFPLLLVPFFLISKVNFLDKLKYLFLVLAVYGITILPFIQSPGFQKDVLFSSLGKRIFELQVHAGSFSISIFVLLYIALLLYRWINISQPLWGFILSILLLVFSLSHFHPQWIIWVTPFLTIAFVKTKSISLTIGLFIISYFLIFAFFQDRFLTTGLLSPISILYLDIPALTQLITTTQLPVVQNIFKLVFGLISFVLIWRILRCNYD